MFFAVHLLTYLVEVHLGEFLLHVLLLLFLNVYFLLMMLVDLVNPLALLLKFVVAHILHGILQTDMRSIVRIFAVGLLADSLTHHGFL